jgi:type II secretory pathway component PulF
MEQEQLDQKIELLEKKMENLQRSIDGLRKVFLWTMIISLALFVIPLIILLFVLPGFISTYTNSLTLPP